MKLLKTLPKLLFLLCNYAIFAQVQITGNVTDNQNVPISGVTISLKSKVNTFGKLTDDTGKFEINAPFGDYKIEVRYLGFQAYKNWRKFYL